MPAILLSDQALALLRDVFGQPDLFSDKQRIDRRIVSWGGSDAVDLPHGAIAVSEADLETALFAPADGAPAAPGDFTIHAMPPFPSGEPLVFGERRAVAAETRLRRVEDASACQVEAVEDGWLFLIPIEGVRAWLLGVGAPLDALLAQSRHVASALDGLGEPSPAFNTCPRLLTGLHGTDWLACGTAAIAFDPICGDGTAQAVREAILASAVIRAIREGGNAEALFTHYESMLIASMRRHLQLSIGFYRSGGQGPWWRAQQAALKQGYDWCTERLAATPEPRYRLEGFRLKAREGVA